MKPVKCLKSKKEQKQRGFKKGQHKVTPDRNPVQKNLKNGVNTAEYTV